MVLKNRVEKRKFRFKGINNETGGNCMMRMLYVYFIRYFIEMM
jgi:hypothetical protein